MKIAVLWTRLSGYMNASLRALAQTPGVELFVAFEKPDQEEAPFDQAAWAWLLSHPHRVWAYKNASDNAAAGLLSVLAAFEPDGLLINSWHIPLFRRVARAYQGKTVRILFMDNPWRATPKQRLGVLIASWHVRPLFDGVFLPGERQAHFARRLGFAESRIRRGAYTCDHEQFAAVYQARGAQTAPLPRAFVFTGRLVFDKAVDALARAYARYRAAAADAPPWPLIVCGTGPLKGRIAGQEGVIYQGFVQPGDLPCVLARAGCLVLPSRVEHWGVAIHEAATSGLAVICSNACGAVPDLVRDDHNGFVVPAGSVAALANALGRYAGLSEARRRAMGDNSWVLSTQFTPQLWADQLCGLVRALRRP